MFGLGKYPDYSDVGLLSGSYPYRLNDEIAQKDLLNLRLEKDARTYWLKREVKKSNQRKLRENILGGTKNEQDRVIERILAVSTPE